MYKYSYALLILLILAFWSCQKPIKKFDATPFDPTATSFSFLNEKIKDVKVLALGESSHGFGTLQSVKVNLVKYLHEKLGYDLLIMQAGYGDVALVDYNQDTGDPKLLMNNMVLNTLKSDQMLPLFEYYKYQDSTKKQLVLRGMDTRITGKAFKLRLQYVIQRLEPKIIQDSIENGLNQYNKLFETMDDEVAWKSHKERYLDAIRLARSILVEGKEDIQELELADEPEVDVMVNYFNMLEKAVDYNFGEAYTRGLALRDSIMAANVIQFVEKEFPKTKVILWGHNGHIEKGSVEGDNSKWLGHYLKDKFGDDYYAMGMFVKKGLIYQVEGGKTSNFNLADPSFIEEKIRADYGSNVYLDLPEYDPTNTGWFNQSYNGYELEAGGKVQFVPTKRFDGILFIEETEAPTYDVHKSKSRR